MLIRYLKTGLLIVSTSGMACAQTTVDPPRFKGDRAAASSVDAIVPNDAQRLVDQKNRTLLNALTGAAMFEAAREEGRYFVQERRQKEVEIGED
ncbi:MAG: hypothetical protein R8G34_16425 [Paracoccaceae bacterium]|nr:hypothetical protein [Paracoccaceae bacterium]